MSLSYLTHTEPSDTLCGLTDDVKTSNLQVNYQKLSGIRELEAQFAFFQIREIYSY